MIFSLPDTIHYKTKHVGKNYAKNPKQLHWGVHYLHLRAAVRMFYYCFSDRIYNMIQNTCENLQSDSKHLQMEISE